MKIFNLSKTYKLSKNQTAPALKTARMKSAEILRSL